MKKIFGALIILLGLTIPMACSNNPTSPALTPTPIPTATFWAGYTATNTITPTVTPTITATNLGGITSTPTSTATNTPTPTITNTAFSTATPTVTSTPTNTGTPTNTFAATPLPYKTGWAQPNVNFPNGLALGNGNIYLAEGDGNSGNVVQVLTSGGGAVTTLTQYGSAPFGEPYGVAVNQGTGNFYVLDRLKNTVYEFNSAGATVTSWSSWSGGSATSFLNPEGIAVDGGGNIYVADTGNNTVEEFTTTGSTVNYINQWNTGTGLFSSPSAVAAVISAGPVKTLYVADAGNELIQVYNGSSWSSFSTVSGSDVLGITVDGSGNVFAADLANSLVEEYNAGGNLIVSWNSVSGSTAFVSPDGVVSSGSDIWVTDFENGTNPTGSVQEFGP